jgi:hypothetical protein
VIEVEEFVERLCRLGADRGPRNFPRKQRDREILIKSLRMLLDHGRIYSEPDINAAIQAWRSEVAPAISTDHVTLRRLLVDHGHLERTADGRAYRIGFPSKPMAFDVEIDDIDVRATIAAYLEQQRSKRRRGPPKDAQK